MERTRKVAIIAVMVGIGVFGYIQYAWASQMEVVITQSELVEKTEHGSHYNVELQFDNPSLLMLAVGESEFFVAAGDETIGKGQLESFVLPAMGTILVNGSFQTETELDRDDPPTLKITGLTKYDMLITAIEIPFVFYPTEEQTRKFVEGS